MKEETEKKTSRQTLWARKQRAGTKCPRCGSEKPKGQSLCNSCLLIQAQNLRKITGRKPWQPGSRGRIPFWAKKSEKVLNAHREMVSNKTHA
jgi:hypothetical protein